MHLSNNDIMRFVSMQDYTEENIAFSKVVNTHILNCEVCLAKVRAFQAAYDVLCAENDNPDITDVIAQIMKMAGVDTDNDVDLESETSLSGPSMGLSM